MSRALLEPIKTRRQVSDDKFFVDFSHRLRNTTNVTPNTRKAISIVGGGDVVSAVKQSGSYVFNSARLTRSCSRLAI